MDDIHTPSVASSRQTNGVTASSKPRTLTELSAEKDHIESELSALSSVLDSHGVNMTTTLTTFDGFPRADVDVPQIRTTRARIIRLRNDYKAIMAQIEKAVQDQFASLAAHPNSQPVSALPARAVGATPAGDATAYEPETPFATIDNVVPQSPADIAGLQVGDKIVKFGRVNWLNHERLRKVAEVVSQSEGRPLPVSVLRGTTKTELTLTPKANWGGRGLLGCHLVPLS